MLDDDERYIDDGGEIVGELTPLEDQDAHRHPADITDITLLFEIGIKEELALPIMARAEALGLKPTEYMRRIVLAHAGVDILPPAAQEAPPAEDTPDAA